MAWGYWTTYSAGPNMIATSSFAASSRLTSFSPPSKRERSLERSESRIEKERIMLKSTSVASENHESGKKYKEKDFI